MFTSSNAITSGTSNYTASTNTSMITSGNNTRNSAYSTGYSAK